MTARVVTFSVQLGSGGFALARALAERLEYRYCDSQVTSQAATEAGVSPEVIASAERVPSLVERMFERFLATSFYAGEIPETGTAAAVILDSALHNMTSSDYRRLIEQVVEKLAAEGKAVIVGHASQVTLAKQPDVLKVYIHGSPEKRAQRMVAEEGSAPDEAAALIQQLDRDREGFFKRYYHIDWRDADNYDLSLNTDALSHDAALDLLLAAAQGIGQSAPTAAPTV